VARRPSRLALFEVLCQGASEDFVPPAAQRKAVRRTWTKKLAPLLPGLSPRQYSARYGGKGLLSALSHSSSAQLWYWHG